MTGLSRFVWWTAEVVIATWVVVVPALRGRGARATFALTGVAGGPVEDTGTVSVVRFLPLRFAQGSG